VSGARRRAGRLLVAAWLAAASAPAIWFWIVEPFTESGRTRRVVQDLNERATTQDARREHLEEHCAEAPYVATVGALAGLDEAKAERLVTCSHVRVEFCADAVRAGDRPGFEAMRCDRVLSRYDVER
jgi:hypothetical protein